MKIEKQEIAQALRVLDTASEELLKQATSSQDMLKEVFRRDAVTLNQAAAILEDFGKNFSKIKQE
jgi:hypothetical protein